ncbi:MAG TPA: exonuclease domain-containing protein [Bacteriovoracaceae bacterium]|nr:exonuclease domain-containing protein [Bacteriovoracaceae bacterium]
MSRSQSALILSSLEVSSILKLFPKGLVAVDLETTGLSPLVDKIIEIAAVKVTPEGQISAFHQLINPLIDIPEFTIQFHGLTNEHLKLSPTIRKPLKEFWEFSGRFPMIAHNSTFDLGYLIKSSHDFQIEFPPLDIYDSCRFLRAIFKNKDLTAPKNFKLSTLSEFYGIELHHHVAMEDTLACLKIMAHAAAIDVDHKIPMEKSFVFRLSHFNRNDCFNYSTRLEGLKLLVQSKKLVVLDYRGGSAIGKVRPVRPIGLMPLPKGPVLFAECLLTGMNKSFLLKKIKTYAELDACYWRPQMSPQ